MATINISDNDTITFYIPFAIDRGNHTITLLDFTSSIDYLDFTYDTLDDYPVLDIHNDNGPIHEE